MLRFGTTQLSNAMNILIWDIRGAAKSFAFNHLKKFIRENRIQVVILLETRLEQKSAEKFVKGFNRH